MASILHCLSHERQSQSQTHPSHEGSLIKKQSKSLGYGANHDHKSQASKGLRNLKHWEVILRGIFLQNMLPSQFIFSNSNPRRSKQGHCRLSFGRGRTQPGNYKSNDYSAFRSTWMYPICGNVQCRWDKLSLPYHMRFETYLSYARHSR